MPLHSTKYWEHMSYGASSCMKFSYGTDVQYSYAYKWAVNKTWIVRMYHFACLHKACNYDWSLSYCRRTMHLKSSEPLLQCSDITHSNYWKFVMVLNYGFPYGVYLFATKLKIVAIHTFCSTTSQQLLLLFSKQILYWDFDIFINRI